MSSIVNTAEEQIDYIPLDATGPLDRARSKSRKGQMRLLLWGLPIIVFVLIAIFGPLLVPYDSVTVRTGDRLKEPG